MAEVATTASHDAFISYSRKDRAFAQRLEKALKSWTPPPELGLPARNVDVFRDESDFTGTDYYAAIEQHLQRSRKLILVCSPAARASSYVDDEIRRFVRLQSAGAVIPLLLAGVPNNEAGPERAAEMAFPAALCEALQMPLATSYLGFDAQRDRPDRAAFEPAWYQLLANLLDKSRSEVEQRDRRRQARQRRITGGIVAAVIAALSVALVVTLLARQETERQRVEAVTQRELAEQRQREAEEQHRIAEERRRAAQARQLNVEADAALLEPEAQSLQRSQLLRLQSLAASWTAEGHAALLRSIDRLVPAARVLQPGPDRPPLGLAFSPDGRRLAITSSIGTRIVDLTEARELHKLPVQGQVLAPVFSSDGRTLLAACREGRACLWDTARWRVLQHLEGRQDVMSADLAPDGSLFAVAGRSEGSFALIESRSGRPPAWLAPHAAALTKVGRVAFSPDGRWLATQGGGVLQLWDLRARRPALQRKVGRSEALAFSADGTLLLHAGDEDKPVVARLNATASGGPVLTTEARFVLPRSNSRIRPQFNRQGTRLALGLDIDRSVAFYDIVSGSEVARIAARTLGLAFDRDGALAAGHDDGRVTLWTPDRPEARHMAVPGVAALAMDRDGRHLALLAGGTLTLAEPGSGRALATAPADPAADQLDYSPDARWLVARAPRSLRVYAADDVRELRRLEGEAAEGETSWSTDGRWLLLRGSSGVRALDSRDWTRAPVSVAVMAESLTTSPDGRWLATRSSWSFSRGIGLTHPSMTRVWDLADGSLKAWVSHEDEDLKSSMFAPLGRASGATGEWTSARSGGDGALAAAGPGWPPLRTVVEARRPEQTWITRADARKTTLAAVHLERAGRAHRGPVKAWGYSNDGRWFASAGGDVTVRLWPVHGDELAAETCRRVGRNLSEEEWRRHFGDEPYRETCPGLPRGKN
jgi:WD40 repeat protein